jgi:hypothetical protein
VNVHRPMPSPTADQLPTFPLTNDSAPTWQLAIPILLYFALLLPSQ